MSRGAIPSYLEYSPENLFESAGLAVAVLHADGRCLHANATAGLLFGRQAESLLGRDFWNEFPQLAGGPLQQAWQRWTSSPTSAPPEGVEAYLPALGRWLDFRLHPARDGLLLLFRDISRQKYSELTLVGQSRALALMAQGEPLELSLDALLRGLEEQSPGLLCSILLLAEDGKHVRHGAAPSLPPSYVDTINGMAIGPIAGSCGTAMHRQEPVYVQDIASDPLWVSYKELALRHGLRACWSTPILDASRRVMGSFAIYYCQPSLPQSWHLELIGVATHTAAICISRHRVDVALHLSEARYALAVRGTSEGLWDWNIRTNADYLSPRWKELLGFSEAELPNHSDSFFQRLHPEDRPRVENAVRAHLERREPYDLEIRLLTKSGEYRWFRSRGQAEWDEHGRPLRMAGALADISRHKESEAAMLDAAMFNRQIIVGANEGIAVLDRKLRYIVWNPYLEQLLGLRATDVLARHPLEIFPWMKEGGQIAAVERALGGETVVLTENQRMRTGPKRISWLQARLAPLRDARRDIVGVIVMISDISERMEAEKRLRALAARLHLVREEQSAHIAREIHDVLGQQLTAIKLDLTWLKRRASQWPDAVVRQALIDKLTETSTLVDDTIRNVQKVATELRPGLLDKLGLPAALEHEARAFAARSSLECDLQLPTAVPRLTASRALEVFRICQEMLTNVARHAQATRFAVHLEETPARLVLTVRDNGRGLKSKDVHGSLSLGILGMQERAQLLGGRLDFASAPAQGTAATLTIPLPALP